MGNFPGLGWKKFPKTSPLLDSQSFASLEPCSNQGMAVFHKRCSVRTFRSRKRKKQHCYIIWFWCLFVLITVTTRKHSRVYWSVCFNPTVFFRLTLLSFILVLSLPKKIGSITIKTKTFYLKTVLAAHGSNGVCELQRNLLAYTLGITVILKTNQLPSWSTQDQSRGTLSM